MAGIWRVDARNAVNWPQRSIPSGAPGSASGLGTVTGRDNLGVGTAQGGVQAAVGISQVGALSTGTAIGTSSAFGFLSSGARNYRPIWRVARQNTVSWSSFAPPASSQPAVGTVICSSTPTGVGRSLDSQAGTAAGITTVDGVTLGSSAYQWNWKVYDPFNQVYFWFSKAPVNSSIGTATGVGTATAIAAGSTDSLGVANGSASVVGVGVGIGSTIGVGTITADAFVRGFSTIIWDTVGTAEGTSASFSTDTTYDGFAAGTATVLGVGARHGRRHGRWTDEPPDVQTWTTQPKDE